MRGYRSLLEDRDMLAGHTVGLLECTDSSRLLLKNPVSGSDDEESELSSNVLHMASFEELSRPHLQYDTVIWVLISLLLVLAWGIGVIMLLYLPRRRYILYRDISSRRLYVTRDEIVYKVTRPSFLPFLGLRKIEKRVPLHTVIDVIIEQGFLQSIYGIHTFRVENIAHGKAVAVDELQVQGVSDPDLLRKVIISGAAKCIRLKRWTAVRLSWERESPLTRIDHLSVISPVSRFRSPSGKMVESTRYDSREEVPGDFLSKLEEIEQSVKKLESLVGGSEVGIEEC